jgi:hypothetical protein
MVVRESKRLSFVTASSSFKPFIPFAVTVVEPLKFFPELRLKYDEFNE